MKTLHLKDANGLCAGPFPFEGPIEIERPASTVAPSSSATIPTGAFSVPLRLDMVETRTPTLAEVLQRGAAVPGMDLTLSGQEWKGTRIRDVVWKVGDVTLGDDGDHFAHKLSVSLGPWRVDPTKDKARRKALAERRRIRHQKHGWR